MELDELSSKHEAMKTTHNEVHGKMMNDWTELRLKAEARLITIRLHEQTIETLTRANEDQLDKINELDSTVTHFRENVCALREEISDLRGRESVRLSMLDSSQDETSNIRAQLERLQLVLNVSGLWIHTYIYYID